MEAAVGLTAQLECAEQTDRPGTESHLRGKPRTPSNGEASVVGPRPLGDRSFPHISLTFRVAGHAVWTLP